MQKRKKHWFLHVKRWKRGRKICGASLFLVNTVLKTSIALDTHIGHPDGYKSIETAREPAIIESKKLLKKYLRNELPPEREIGGIQGTRTSSFSII